jgi:hypothetical protein
MFGWIPVMVVVQLARALRATENPIGADGICCIRATAVAMFAWFCVMSAVVLSAVDWANGKMM